MTTTSVSDEDGEVGTGVSSGVTVISVVNTTTLGSRP